jgi:hypothetical protein
MHLTLFALAVLVTPPLQVVQPPPQAPPADPTELETPSTGPRLTIRIGLTTRSVGPANAALTFSRLLGDLRDSMHRSRPADTTLAIAIRSLLPTASPEDRRGKEYEVKLALTVGPDALPKVVEVLGHLATGSVTVTDLSIGAEGTLPELAQRMLAAATDSSVVAPSASSKLSRLAQLAILLLAIRREVTR